MVNKWVSVVFFSCLAVGMTPFCRLLGGAVGTPGSLTSLVREFCALARLSGSSLRCKLVPFPSASDPGQAPVGMTSC
jgi:hypothetical protein